MATGDATAAPLSQALEAAPRRRRKLELQLAVALAAVVLFSLLPNSNFVRDAYNSAIDWLEALRPPATASTVLDRRFVLVRVQEGSVSRGYNRARAEWKDPPILFDRGHVADLLEALVELRPHSIVVLINFPRVPLDGSSSDRLSEVVQRIAQSEAAPYLFLRRRARAVIPAEVPDEAIGYRDYTGQECRQALPYDTLLEAAATSGRVIISPLEVQAEGGLVRYVSPLAAFCMPSATLDPRLTWTMPAVLAHIARGLALPAAAPHLPSGCDREPNSVACLAAAAASSNHAAGRLELLDSIRISPTRSAPDGRVIATAILETPVIEDTRRAVQDAVALIEVGPDLLGAPLRRTGAGPRSLAEIVVAGAATHASPHQPSMPGASARFMVQAAATSAAVAIAVLWGGFVLALLTTAFGLVVFVYGLPAFLPSAVVADVAVGAACAGLAASAAKLAEAARKLLTLLRKAVAALFQTLSRFAWRRFTRSSS